jgi:hypothetical protein
MIINDDISAEIIKEIANKAKTEDKIHPVSQQKM